MFINSANWQLLSQYIHACTELPVSTCSVKKFIGVEITSGTSCNNPKYTPLLDARACQAYCESYSEYKICSLVLCMPVFKSKRFVCRVHSLLSQAGELLANQQTTIIQLQLAMWAVHSVIKLWSQI